MTVVIRFKDEQVEVINGVNKVEHEGGTVKVKSGEADVSRYKCSEIKNIEIVWR